VKQAQVDKLYASLKDLAGDRRLKLDEVLKLYMLNRDIEDLEQWIAEREVVAGSHELGQDFEHVTVRDACQCFACYICLLLWNSVRTTWFWIGFLQKSTFISLAAHMTCGGSSVFDISVCLCVRPQVSFCCFKQFSLHRFSHTLSVIMLRVEGGMGTVQVTLLRRTRVFSPYAEECTSCH